MKIKTIVFLVMSLLSLSSVSAQYGSALTFSEIMFYPNETNGEFIEIYNASATDIIDLTGFKFKYYTSANNNLVPFSGGMLLSPGKYAVILQGIYYYASGNYKDIIPADAIILKTSTNNFGSSGMANTTSRKIFLINAANDTIDTYTYSANNSAGISDEKIILNKDNADANWSNSYINNGTPGSKNSVAPLDYDLSARITGITPLTPVAGDSVTITAVVKNTGRSVATNFSIGLFVDANHDSIGQAGEQIFFSAQLNLGIEDSMVVEKRIYTDKSGDYFVLLSIVYNLDENPNNNTAYLKFAVLEKPIPYNEILINEIMYSPLNDESEWIEVVNNSTGILDLKNCKIGDNTSLVTITAQNYYLNPGEYLIIAADSSILNTHNISSKLLIKSLPAFNNSGDDVRIKNSIGNVVDSLHYTSVWGGTSGKSLERVSLSAPSTELTNWRTSGSKFNSTPGSINSVSQKNLDLALRNFSIIGNYAEVGKEISANLIVENAGNNSVPGYLLKIYCDANLDSIATNNELISEFNGQQLLPGMTKSFDISLTGIAPGQNQFIAGIELNHDEFAENNSMLLKIIGVYINVQRGDLVINEIMYAPNSVEPEWLEMLNTSSNQINLRGYKIENHSTSTTVFSSNAVLDAGSYIVIAKDSSIFTKYTLATNILIASFPTMSNNGDRIVLRDSLYRTIDSLQYKSTWGGRGGKSLERIDPELSSTDSTNWKTCLSVMDGTPGRTNSVSKKEYDLSLDKILFVPALPLKGDKVNISAVVSNNGSASALFKIILFEVLADSSKTKLEESQMQNLSGGDSLNYNFIFSIGEIDGKKTFEVQVDFPADEDRSNNSLFASINPGYPSRAVVINEVMYNPLNGEPEWVELYNSSSFDIDIEGWSISDVVTTPATTVLKPRDLSFPKNSLLVIVKDSTLGNFHKQLPSKMIITSFANLNNDGDGIVIKDSRGSVVDSVRYNQTWGGSNGKSLERKSTAESSLEKSNWGSSTDVELSTPGRVNSLVQKRNDLALVSVLTSPEFPGFGDNVMVSAKILNAGVYTVESFIVDFYLIAGNDTLKFGETASSNLAAGDSLIVTAAQTITVGETKTVYAKIVFAADEDMNNNSSTLNIIPGVRKNTLLISEVMYDPFAGESEWVEIYNASDDQVNLKNWVISDLLPSPKKSIITDHDKMLNAGDYAIITSDTSQFPYYPPANFFQAKFGALSSSDGIMVYDFRGCVIDSLKYNYGWGGTKGQSIERVSFAKATSDSTNWRASLSSSDATPGQANSISSAESYSYGSFVVNEIMYDPAAGNSEYLEFYNTTDDSIQVGGIIIKIGSASKIKLSNVFLKVAPEEYFVLASDSLIFNNYSWLKTGATVVVNTGLSLSNEGIMLVLEDIFGNTIDSLSYSPSWQNKNIITLKNKSLERLNPLLNSKDGKNWNTCVNAEGGSPGRVNSVYTQNLSHDSKVTISPNPFSPDNDGFEDFTIINLDLGKQLSQVRIRIYDSVGRLVRTLENYLPLASKNSIIFDGLDDGGRALRIGIYILLIETVDAIGGGVEVIKTPVVVARKL